jgi:hypothetical protein
MAYILYGGSFLAHSRLTPLAADAASRLCIAARFGYVRHLELKRALKKPRRG